MTLEYNVTESVSYQETDESKTKNFSEDEYPDIEVHSVHSIPTPPKAAVIVCWTSLLVLMNRCLRSTYLLPATITDMLYKGSQMIVKMKCADNHESVGKLNRNRYSVGNLTSAASVLLSANTFLRLSQFFDLASIQWISKSTFYDIQNKYLHGILNKDIQFKV